MTNTPSPQKRLVKKSVVCLVFSLAAIPVYQSLSPWLQFHRDHLIVYDCRLQSAIVPVGAKYPGQIEELYVDIGDSVQAGDPLAKLNTAELDSLESKAIAAVELAKSELTATRLAVEKSLKLAQTEYECAHAKMQVASDQADAFKQEVKWIERKLKRSTSLAHKRSLSPADLDAVRRELQRFQSKAQIALEEQRVAQLELKTAKSQIDKTKARESHLKTLEYKIEIAESEVESLREKRAASVIYSKANGIVSSLVRGAGSSVKTGEPIVEIQEEALWSEIWIDESDLSLADNGSVVQIQLKAHPTEMVTGTVTNVLPNENDLIPNQADNPLLQVDAKVRLKVALAPTRLRLVPGLTGTAIIQKRNSDVDSKQQVTSRQFSKRH